jgi:hypothetical protein
MQARFAAWFTGGARAWAFHRREIPPENAGPVPMGAPAPPAR